jgi:SAM-dependent methyltransferase
MLLTAPGLEMMTHPLVAARRAARLAAGVESVVDLTCGLGGDLAALAASDGRVVGVDRDPVAVFLARANVPGAAVFRGDASTPPVRLDASALFIDPCAAIKGPPGLPARAIPSAAEAEFVQLGRSMREATVWLGEGAIPGLRRAVLLPSGDQLDSTAPECDPTPVPPAAFLLDPESCVTTAGLVRHLGALTGARLLDPHLAYLAAGEPAASPLAAGFEVLDRLEFKLNRLRARLRENRWRPDEIRRRGFPIEPDDLRKLLGRIEGQPVTLLCATIDNQRTVFIARRVVPPASPSVRPAAPRPPRPAP